jgi:hypothetical protein
MSLDCDQYFCVGRRETHITDAIPRAHALFVEHHALLCRPGLTPELLAMLSAFCARAYFRPQQVKGLGHRQVESPSIAGNAIQLALDRKDFRVVQTRPGGQDHLDWHSDTHDNISLGMTIHLTDCCYEGGAFELREAGKRELSFRHDKPKAGDIVVFDIDRRLEHRVRPVSLGEPRLVFTGWFVRRKSA